LELLDAHRYFDFPAHTHYPLSIENFPNASFVFFCTSRIETLKSYAYMHEELRQAVELGLLSQPVAAAIDKLAPGIVCRHKNWGIGLIVARDVTTQKLTIDFESKSGYAMQFVNAAESLSPFAPDHIYTRRVAAKDAVTAEAKKNPVALVAAALADLGGAATLEELAAVFTPYIFATPAEFKRWWDLTKKKLKADGRFDIPSKKNEPVVMRAEAISPAERLFEQFRNANGIAEQVAAAEEIHRDMETLKLDHALLIETLAEMEASARRHLRINPARAIELLLLRDDIAEAIEATVAKYAAHELLAEAEDWREIFEKLSAANQRRALDLLPVAFPQDWEARALSLTRNSGSKMLTEIARFLDRNKRRDALGAALSKWISERSVPTEMLIWFCRERGQGFDELFNTNLLNAIFSAMESDLLDDKRSHRMQDLLVSDQKLLAELLESATPEEVRDVMKRLMMTPAIADLEKRSLLARIIKLYPEMQEMVGGGDGGEDHTLTVSWPSLTARKTAYEYLVDVEIPNNVRDIAVAREQGDLRENFGFKAAKEQQRVLSRRRAEAERSLRFARGTDFANPDTKQVSIGTTVTLTPSGASDGTEETYHILGAWDGSPEHHMVSYKAALGQILLGKKVGEEVMTPHATHPRTVATIAPFADFPALEAFHAEAMKKFQKA